ncbi:MAG TPA: hypothetical protein VGM84_17200 [Steroidobacteraceae bacterium]|jgi:hypothetical protein
MTRSIVRKAAGACSRTATTPARFLAASLTITMALALSGCGLAETGAVAASAAASKADEAKQARQTEARMEQKINDAYKAAADQRQAAEAASQ